ncbi:MAG: DHHA1 domain-containing protein, partial [Verrucomicrobiota bacterium]
DEEENPAKDLTKALENGDLASANGLLRKYEQLRDAVKTAAIQAEKSVKKASAGAAAQIASAWYEETLAILDGDTYVGLLPGDSPALLQEAMNVVKARQFKGAVALGVLADGTLHFGVVVSKDSTDRFKAGDIVRESLAEAGGKGGGKPEMARGAAPDATDKLDAVLAKAKQLLKTS